MILAPTDAALGQAVVTEPRVPGRIRQGLNVESGLNDGICVPLLFAAVAAADVASEISDGRSAATLLLEEIGYGVIGGLAAGVLIGVVIVHAERRDLIDGAWRQVIPAAGAALAYGTAAALGGSGFIAAFVAGMAFRATIKRDPEDSTGSPRRSGACSTGSPSCSSGRFCSARRSGELSWELPFTRSSASRSCASCPSRSRCWAPTPACRRSAFLGWFGPRGLASIVFAVIVIEESQLPHEHLIVLAIYITVGLSVFAHGLTAAPLADRYASWFERHPRPDAADRGRSRGGDAYAGLHRARHQAP